MATGMETAHVSTYPEWFVEQGQVEAMSSKSEDQVAALNRLVRICDSTRTQAKRFRDEESEVRCKPVTTRVTDRTRLVHGNILSTTPATKDCKIAHVSRAELYKALPEMRTDTKRIASYVHQAAKALELSGQYAAKYAANDGVEVNRQQAEESVENATKYARDRLLTLGKTAAANAELVTSELRNARTEFDLKKYELSDQSWLGGYFDPLVSHSLSLEDYNQLLGELDALEEAYEKQNDLYDQMHQALKMMTAALALDAEAITKGKGR